MVAGFRRRRPDPPRRTGASASATRRGQQRTVRPGNDAAAEELAAVLGPGVVGVGDGQLALQRAGPQQYLGNGVETMRQCGGHQQQLRSARAAALDGFRKLHVVADHHGRPEAVEIDDGGGRFRGAERRAFLIAKEVHLGVVEQLSPRSVHQRGGDVPAAPGCYPTEG